MRLAWAIALGIVIAAAVVWWLGRDAPAAPGPASQPANASEQSQGRVLYRWRDDAGVVQVGDRPPRGRDYETLDVDALERRNTFDPRPAEPPPASE
jgi:hypothetical protein